MQNHKLETALIDLYDQSKKLTANAKESDPFIASTQRQIVSWIGETCILYHKARLESDDHGTLNERSNRLFIVLDDINKVVQALNNYTALASSHA